MEENLKDSFLGVGMCPPAETLQKCIDLCTVYNMTADDLVDYWAAYSTTNLKGAPPTILELERMERKDLKRRGPSVIPPLDFTDDNENQQSNCEEASKNISVKLTVTAEEQPPPKCPVNELSAKFAQRQGSGQVQCTYGTRHSEMTTPGSTVKLIYNGMSSKNGSVYMYDTIHLRTTAFNNITKKTLQRLIADKPSLEPNPCMIGNVTNVTLFGRIFAKCAEERLNLNSLYLVGPREYNGSIHHLHFEPQMLDISTFPGQILAVQGAKPKGKFTVKEIFTPELPQNEILPKTDGLIRLLIACGPFTLPTNELYEPLEHLLEQVRLRQPNVVLLLGPFVDASHTLPTTTFEEQFRQILAILFETFSRFPAIHLILIPSHKDAHHSYSVFPTPPFSLQESLPENFHFLTNPDIFTVENIQFAVTTCDVLLHLSKREINHTRNNSGQNCTSRILPDRMLRLAEHVLNQQCFYPLHPPDADVNVDYQLLETFGCLEKRPDVLVLPSQLRHFLKESHGTLVINTERLTKGNIAGTFAVVEVAAGAPAHISQRVYAEIVKV